MQRSQSQGNLQGNMLQQQQQPLLFNNEQPPPPPEGFEDIKPNPKNYSQW